MKHARIDTIHKINKYLIFAFFIHYTFIVVSKLIYAFPDFSEGDWTLTTSFKLCFFNLVIYSTIIYFTIDRRCKINYIVTVLIFFYSIVNIFLSLFILLLIMNKL